VKKGEITPEGWPPWTRPSRSPTTPREATASHSPRTQASPGGAKLLVIVITSCLLRLRCESTVAWRGRPPAGAAAPALLSTVSRRSTSERGSGEALPLSSLLARIGTWKKVSLCTSLSTSLPICTVPIITRCGRSECRQS
jgi:hypothetical protein